MNKNIFVGIVAFIVLVGGGMAYLAMKPSAKTAEKTGSQSQAVAKNEQQPKIAQQTAPIQTPPQPQASPQNNSQPGTFTDYSEAAFANASGDRILFFHAPWCFQCREIEKDIKANLGNIPSNVAIFKIDYDSNQDLRKRYGVKIQTSFVKFDGQGNVIQNFVAYDEPTFANLDKNIF